MFTTDVRARSMVARARHGSSRSALARLGAPLRVASSGLRARLAQSGSFGVLGSLARRRLLRRGSLRPGPARSARLPGPSEEVAAQQRVEGLVEVAEQQRVEVLVART